MRNLDNLPTGLVTALVVVAAAFSVFFNVYILYLVFGP